MPEYVVNPTSGVQRLDRLALNDTTPGHGWPAASPTLKGVVAFPAVAITSEELAGHATFSVLGSTAVTVDGRAVALRSIRQRRLVAALLLAGGRPVSADRLAEALWVEALPRSPAGALQNQISRLRAALGDLSAVIETVPGGYRLAVHDNAIDSARFERVVHEARSSGSPLARAEQLNAAVAMWRGEAYEDLDTVSARAEAIRLTELRLGAEEDAAAALVEAGRLDVALPALEAFCAREPLRERPRVELAAALRSSGRRAEALRVLDDFRRVLASELGIDPSQAVAALYTSVLGDDEDSRQTIAGQAAPRRFSPVFGRDADILGAEKALAQARIVTLVGPGGVGKTTLAHVLAALANDRYEHGCCYIDLAAVTGPDEVASAFARGLGIDVREPTGLIERLIDALAHRRALLVVDNAEQVVERVGVILSNLIAHTDGIDALVTSREPLNISGERLWPVEPLPAADSHDAAIELFVDRATAVRPGWVPQEAEMAAVVEICRRLDGLPLAIELAAGHVRFRSGAEIVRDLGRSLDLLERAAPDVAGHRGLRATMDWSYELLDPLQATVFDRLGAFTNGFIRDSVRRACSDVAAAEGVDVILDGLVDRSLVGVAARPYGSRYSLLEPIRRYALAHLIADDQDQTARRGHANALLELAEEVDACIAGPEEARWAAVLDDERPDVVAACRWLVDHDLDAALRLVRAVYFYAFPRGRADLQALPELVLTSVERAEYPADPSLLAAVYGVAADHALTVGDLARARSLLDLGFDVSDGAPGADRYCQGAAGDLALFTGATTESARHYRLGSEGFRVAGHDVLADWLMALSALPEIYGGDRAEGRAIASRAVSTADETSCPSAQAGARYVAAEALVGVDDAGARQHLDDAVRLADSVGASYIGGLAHLSLATLEARAGNVGASLPHYVVLLDMWRRSGNWAQQWTTLRTLVVVLAELGRHEAAVRLLAGIDANAQAPRWGEDDDRLVAAEQSARGALNPSVFAQATLDGSRASSSEVLALAQIAVEAALVGP